ncbi:MAG: bacillithiol biosynthesis deacetylase BshB1 [Thermoanaerobaculia bacterium]
MTVDVVAFGAHPDDVELGCGGTLAKLVAAGRTVGIVHLTRGEAGSRGSAEIRRREAEAAAAALGASELRILDFGDGALRTGAAEEEELISVFRDLRPELVFAPTPADRHPDHARSHRLVREAAFYAGLRRRGSGRPHRPGALFSYPQHDPIEPAFIVDVTATWEAKMRALDAYGSQLHRVSAAARAPEPDGDPPTKIASREYRLAVEGRARHYGQLIGAELGEGFLTPTPLAIADPWQLLPTGLR